MSAQALEKVSIIPQESGLPAAMTPMTPMAMLGQAVASGADINVLTKLMDLSERWEANNARKAFDEAISAAKAEIPTIQKNREVDFTSSKGRTHYKYEDLGEIAKTVGPILAKHGLSYRYRVTSQVNEPVTVTCIVTHKAGHFEETTLCAGRDESGNKNSIQAIGSTLTYLQRMTLKAALGLAVANDDDGRSSESGSEISEEQLATLVALADEVGADKERFCKYLKVESFAAIPASQFKRAREALNAKRATQ